jgi:hypothetical protein
MITIKDLEQNEELDQQAMRKVFGGRADVRLTPAPGSQLRQNESPFASTVPGLQRPSWHPGS